MEITSMLHRVKKMLRSTCFVTMLLLAAACLPPVNAQAQKYLIRDGKMFIELSKHLGETALDNFIASFDLFDLDLKQFLITNSPDSLQKRGWKLEKNNRDQLIISKLLKGFDNFNNPADIIKYTEKSAALASQFAAVSSSIRFGYNTFKKKYPFLVKDSAVTFFLRNNRNARNVMLAGSFNNWLPSVMQMERTDSGWIATVKLAPGKYWYKFIVDGNWVTDNENARVENDGQGNNNSVYYMPNTIFRLDGFSDAKKVVVAGSFNDWQPRQLQMIKTNGGWRLPLYLADGTHTYRFVVDGNWKADPANKDRLPNEFNDYNSVIKLGLPYTFVLAGYTQAKKVILAGSFNNWKRHELLMNKTADGWELPYTLAEGNHEYRFMADGKWINDPKQNQPNRYIIVGVNHTFRLKGFSTASKVFIAGDFNDWSPASYGMKKAGDEWVLGVHLSRGKHLYKYVIDGKWITDPGNKLWEQNEFGTGNSVIWYEK